MHIYQTRDIIDDNSWHTLRTDLFISLAASNECKRLEHSDTWLTARSAFLYFWGWEEKLSEIQGNGEIPPSLLLLSMHFMLENSMWKGHRIHGTGHGAKQGTGTGGVSTNPRCCRPGTTIFPWNILSWPKSAAGFALPPQDTARTPCQGSPHLPFSLWGCIIIYISVFHCFAFALLKRSLCCVHCSF